LLSRSALFQSSFQYERMETATAGTCEGLIETPPFAQEQERAEGPGRLLVVVRSACLKRAVAFVATRWSVRRRSPLVQRETESVSSVSIGPNSRRQHLVEAGVPGSSEARSSPDAGPTALPIQEQQIPS
jgi:organic hydroperoxide reductase OsmC/OhrA